MSFSVCRWGRGVLQWLPLIVSLWLGVDLPRLTSRPALIGATSPGPADLLQVGSGSVLSASDRCADLCVERCLFVSAGRSLLTSVGRLLLSHLLNMIAFFTFNSCCNSLRPEPARSCVEKLLSLSFSSRPLPPPTPLFCNNSITHLSPRFNCLSVCKRINLYAISVLPASRGPGEPLRPPRALHPMNSPSLSGNRESAL